MLDEFSTTKIEIKEESATISVPGRPAPATVADEPDLEGLSDDDFAKQLQAGMADLLGGIDTSVSSSLLPFTTFIVLM
jgi:peroxin-19